MDRVHSDQNVRVVWYVYALSADHLDVLAQIQMSNISNSKNSCFVQLWMAVYSVATHFSESLVVVL